MVKTSTLFVVASYFDLVFHNTHKEIGHFCGISILPINNKFWILILNAEVELGTYILFICLILKINKTCIGIQTMLI
jgi:hypothetical protein